MQSNIIMNLYEYPTFLFQISLVCLLVSVTFIKTRLILLKTYLNE
jgi:hypothetical protein